MSAKNFISTDEYKKLKKELDYRIDSRSEITKEFREAADLGDDRENFPMDAAIAKQRVNERRIQELQGFLNSVEVGLNSDSNVISLGTTFEVEYNGTKRILKMISSEQAIVRYDRNNISADSNLGKLLLGKKPGDSIEFNSPSGTVIYVVKKII